MGSKDSNKERSTEEKIKELSQAYLKIDEKPKTDQVIESKARIAGSLATLYWQQDNFSEARRFFIIALDNYLKIEDEFHAASVQGALGSMYLQIENYNAALHYTLKANEYWKSKTHLNEKIITLQNLGIIYKNLNQIDKVVDYILNAMKLSIQLQDEDEFAKSIQVLLEYYESIEDYPTLRELKLKALEFWVSLGLYERQFKTLMDLGVIHQILERYDESISYYKQGFNVAYDLGDLEKMYLAQGFIAEVYFNQKDLQKARVVYIEAYKLAVYIGNLMKKEEKIPDSGMNRINKSKLVLLSLGVKEEELERIDASVKVEAEKTKQNRS